MASRAQDKGVEYWLNSLATDLEVRDSGVTVKATCRGERVSLEARAVVIATGFGSKFLGGLGLGRVTDFAVGVQAEVEVAGIDEVEIYFGQEVAPGFFAWLVPTSSQKALVGLMARRNPRFYLKKLMLSLLAQGKIASAEGEPIYSGIPLKPPPRTYSDRLVVVGNAAGQVKPTTGGGIYFGLLCAEIAAKTLHRGLVNGDLSARVLADYERKWRKKLGRELEIDYYARKFYERLSDWQIDRLFDIIKAHDIDEALLKAKDLSFDWHSRAVLRLMGHGAISKVLEVMKIPFRPWG
jgi:flavin-dependent dehydrogenase